MIQAGTCEHGIPLDEGCVLCLDHAVRKERTRASTTLFDQDVERFVKHLERAKEWICSDELICELTWKEEATTAPRMSRFTKTYLRHLARAAHGRIISGQQGYKATKLANFEEVQETAGALLRGAKGYMDRRSDVLFVHHHGRTRTEEERKRAHGKETTEAPAGNAVCDEKLHDGTIQSEAS